MITEAKGKVKGPLTRRRFTEEVEKHSHMREHESSQGQTDLFEELVSLKEKPIIPGRATIAMMEQFRKFPWTQDSMLAVGQLDEALMEFLRLYVEVDNQELAD